VVGDFFAQPPPRPTPKRSRPFDTRSSEATSLGRQDRIALRDQRDAGAQNQVLGGDPPPPSMPQTDPVGGSTSLAESGHRPGTASSRRPGCCVCSATNSDSNPRCSSPAPSLRCANALVGTEGQDTEAHACSLRHCEARSSPVNAYLPTAARFDPVVRLLALRIPLVQQ